MLDEQICITVSNIWKKWNYFYIILYLDKFIYSVYSYYKIIFLYKFCRRLKGREKKIYKRYIFEFHTNDHRISFSFFVYEHLPYSPPVISLFSLVVIILPPLTLPSSFVHLCLSIFSFSYFNRPSQVTVKTCLYPLSPYT